MHMQLIEAIIIRELIVRGHHLHQASCKAVRAVLQAWIVRKLFKLWAACCREETRSALLGIALVFHTDSLKGWECEEGRVGCFYKKAVEGKLRERP